MSGSSRRPLSGQPKETNRVERFSISNDDFAMRRRTDERRPIGTGPPASTHATINPMYPPYPSATAMRSATDASQVDELRYLNIQSDPGYSANNMLAPGQIPAQDYQRAHQIIPEHSRDHHYNFKFSDEQPLERNVKNYHNITRRRKLWVSSLKEQSSGQVPENFSVELVEGSFKNIRALRIVQVQVVYTATATAITNAFLHLPDLGKAEVTSDGKEYHAYFPNIVGSAATVVRYNFVFPDPYIVDFKKLDIIKNRLRVEVFKEDSTNGDLVAFTELDSFAVELEILSSESDGYMLEKPVCFP